MSWQQLIFNCPSKQSDPLSSLLSQQGALSVSLQDAGDEPIYEPPLNSTPVWSETIMSGLFNADQDLRPVMAKVKSSLGKNIAFKIEIVEEKDWVREWMENYQPIRFGNNLWICPSWMEPPEADAINIMLDPGLAFGTGTHATTALCLQWLEEFTGLTDDSHVAEKKQAFNTSLRGKTVLDFGCGSGILAVAAAKLGAKHVYAVDIDPQAVEASIENAKKNHLSDNISFFLVKDFEKAHPHLQVDIMLANILARPLMDLADSLSNYVKPSGSMVLSGILESQQQQVLACYQQQFSFKPSVVKDEWVRLVANKVEINAKH